MEPTVVTAIISGLVGVVTAIIGYMTARNAAKKDIFVTDRQQLSQEQQQLRAEMREEIKSLKEEVARWTNRYLELEANMEQLKITNLTLQMEVDKWREKYDALLVENKELTARVNELEGELRKRRKEDRK